MLQEPEATPLKLWGLWGAFVIAFVAYQFLLPGKTTVESAISETTEFRSIELVMTGISALIFIGITVCRWFLIEKINDKAILLKIFIVSLAFGESIVFFALFLISPNHQGLKLGLILISGLCILQMMPIFLKSDQSSV